MADKPKPTYKLVAKEKITPTRFVVRAQWSDGVEDSVEVDAPQNAEQAAAVETLIHRTLRERREGLAGPEAKKAGK